MSSQTPQDFTPESGGPTDVAPLGRSGPKPEHEKTADEDANPYDWAAIANDPAFAALKAAKLRFIIPATIFFLVYYMTLPILVGYFPDLMKTPVWGKVNWAYLYALSQFIMTWVICAMYVRTAKRWDKLNTELLARFPRQ
jgi:uncharacterized membrane protein (DUF485 family)